MISLSDKKKCTGCGACVQVCALGAVSMKEDKEGFLFPVINEDLCVSCKKCIDSCPAEKAVKKTVPKGIYAARTQDEAVVAKSSSGGLFSVFAAAILQEGGVVFGAGYDESLNLIHKSVTSEDSIKELAGSKYVQSDVKDTYKSVKSHLDNGKKVLFAGTPCQCAGLSAYLSKEYSNLFLVDFVCHGVPSPGLYKKYLEFMGKRGEIKSVRFRDKTIDKKSGHYISIEYSNGEVYREASVNDPYMLAFLQNISLRKSCYNCAFKDYKTSSDITIGDFWGIEKTDSCLSDKDGVSLVILHTEKGQNFFCNIEDRIVFDKRTEQEALRDNKSISVSTGNNPLRDKFLRDMNRLDINRLSKKYCSNSVAAKIRRLVAKRRKDR